MSEYQYYQFEAIDRPLTDRQMSELREISTRAEITATSFVNEYHWGDLKADPLDFMKRYFDAHVYVANWGTHVFMLKVPRDLVDVDAAREYETEYTLSIHLHRDSVIFNFCSPEDARDDDWDSGEGWLASLLPLRDDLMQGDLRSLYLGWLAWGWEDQDDPEPPIPPGLGQLTGPLRSLAGFMYVDPDLLDAAAEASSGAPPAAPGQEDVDLWVKRLPASEKNRVLSQLLSADEPTPHLVGGLRRRFQKEWSTAHRAAAPDTSAPRRTAAQLLETSEALAEQRRRHEAEREARERARREKKAAEERKRYLKAIAPKEEEIWREVESLLQTTRQNDYKRAVEWLKDLRDLALMSSEGDQWEERVVEFRRRYSRKSSLMKRFNAADFPS
jgi:hypothetical protein